MTNKVISAIRKAVTIVFCCLAIILIPQSPVLAARETSGMASIQQITGEASSLLETQAGITAWFKNPTAINLNLAEATFRNVEKKTSDYIIGTVQIRDGLGIQYDAHALVHSEGWVVAYYSNTDNIGKIYDAYLHDSPLSESTTLYQVLKKISNNLQLTLDTQDVKYYDFRFPSANRLMIIRNNSANSNSFITIPACITLMQVGAAIGDWSATGAQNWGNVELVSLAEGIRHKLYQNGNSSGSGWSALYIDDINVFERSRFTKGFGLILLYQE